MITGWVLKLIAGIALAGFLVIELGSPLIARAQVDDAAHNVADEAAFTYFTSRNPDQARATATQEAAKDGVELVTFQVGADTTVMVRVRKQARSYLLKKFSVTRDWTIVQASASAVPKQPL